MDEVTERIMRGDLCERCAEWIGYGFGSPRRCDECRRAGQREEQEPGAASRDGEGRA